MHEALDEVLVLLQIDDEPHRLAVAAPARKRRGIEGEEFAVGRKQR